MKTYAISLKRSKERRKYITGHLSSLQLDYHLIEAIDGKELTENDLISLCDYSTVKKLRRWLTNGTIGCALSHLKAYRAFLDTDERYALIVEDDVHLPTNIKDILEEIMNNINYNEAILLYFTSKSNVFLSTIGSTKLTGEDYITQLTLNPFHQLPRILLIVKRLKTCVI